MGLPAAARPFPGNATAPGKRLLIPIDATDESRWGLRYALRLAESGVALDICLLYVAEPVRAWQVLRFYTEGEVRKHFQDCSAIYLEEAAKVLRARSLNCRKFFREADSVGGVIDLAEELECTEIVVPHMQWLGLFPTGLGKKLVNRHCSIPVTLVRPDGSTAP